MRELRDLLKLKEKSNVLRKKHFLAQYNDVITKVEEAYILGEPYYIFHDYSQDVREEFVKMFNDFHSLRLVLTEGNAGLKYSIQVGQSLWQKQSMKL